MIMGQTGFARRLIALTVLAAMAAAPMAGCRKLGMDDSPRTVPEGAMPVLGPKRPPAAQNSSVESPNTKEARKAMAQGLLSPDPAAPFSPPQQLSSPQIDSSSSYADGNFWANGSGWSSNPGNIPATTAPPTRQTRAAIMPQPQRVTPPPGYGRTMGMPMQQQAFAQPPAAIPVPMVDNTPGMLMPQQRYSPVQMQVPSAAPIDFPPLQETPVQPYYRSNNEIAADIADLQNQSNMAMMYRQMPPAQDMAMPNPVAMADPGYYPPSAAGMSGYNQSPFPSALPPEAPMAYPSQPPAAIATNMGWNSPAPMGMAAPGNYMEPAPAYPSLANAVDYGQPAAPLMQQQPPAAMMAPAPASTYNAASFVPPSPVAGVAEAPVMAQDWDTSAYRGQQQANGGYAGGTPIQLQMPYAGNSQQFLPDSRYSGRGQRLAPPPRFGY